MSFGAGFLRNPDLFPARPAGELGRPRAGARPPRRALPVLRPLRGPGGDGARPLRRLRVAAPAAGARPCSGPRRATSARSTPAAGSTGWTSTARPSAVRLAGLDLAGRLDWRPALGGALWTPAGEGDRFPGILENFFRVLVAYRLHELGGAVIHGAAVVAHGDGACSSSAARARARRPCRAWPGARRGGAERRPERAAPSPEGAILAGLAVHGRSGGGDGARPAILCARSSAWRRAPGTGCSRSAGPRPPPA